MGTFLTSKDEISAYIKFRTYLNKYYKEIADNLDIKEASAKDSFVFSLKGTGLKDIKSHIGSKFSAYHEFELSIKYPNNGVLNRDKNYEEFIEIIKGIVALANFNNFTTMPTFVDLDKYNSLGSFKFMYGNEGLC